MTIQEIGRSMGVAKCPEYRRSCATENQDAEMELSEGVSPTHVHDSSSPAKMGSWRGVDILLRKAMPGAIYWEPQQGFL